MPDYRRDGDPSTTTHVEEASHNALILIDCIAVSQRVREQYLNFVLANVNDHCVRMAVMSGEYRWHKHPRSDELFLVLEGELEIDVVGRDTVRVRPGEVFCIPAGIVHRTRAAQRTVNLCFETRDAYTDVVFLDTPGSASP